MFMSFEKASPCSEVKLVLNCTGIGVNINWQLNTVMSCKYFLFMTKNVNFRAVTYLFVCIFPTGNYVILIEIMTPFFVVQDSIFYRHRI